MGDTCEICKKNPAKIGIGNHSYCFDCHNKMALHDMGIDDSFTYAKNISVIEPNGEWSTSYFLKAQEIGRAITKRLREVEHDDDWFPVGDIQMICRIVDPYGTDEELQRYLEGEE